MFIATDQQIADWKAKYGRIFALPITDKDGIVYQAYFRMADRKAISAATLSASQPIGMDPIIFGESLLDSTWLDGDAEIKTRDDLFLVVTKTLGELIPAASGKLQEL